LRGGLLRYAAQEIPQIDPPEAEKRAIYAWKLARIKDAVGYNRWESFSAVVLTREIQPQEAKNKGEKLYPMAFITLSSW